MSTVTYNNADGSRTVVQQDSKGKEISRQQTQAPLSQREIASERLVRQGVNPDDAARMAAQQTTSSSNQQYQQATPQPKPKPAYATLPSGQSVPVSGGVAEKLRQGQADEQAQQIMLSNNASFSKTTLTEKQYAEKYPRQYEEERRGMAVSASDVALNENPDDAKAAQIQAKYGFNYPAPRERFEFAERDLRALAQDNAYQNIAAQNPKNNNIANLDAMNDISGKNLLSLIQNKAERASNWWDYGVKQTFSPQEGTPTLKRYLLVAGYTGGQTLGLIPKFIAHPIDTSVEVGKGLFDFGYGALVDIPAAAIVGNIRKEDAAYYVKSDFGKSFFQSPGETIISTGTSAVLFGGMSHLAGKINSFRFSSAEAQKSGMLEIAEAAKPEIVAPKGYEIKNLQTFNSVPGIGKVGKPLTVETPGVIGKVSGVSNGKGWGADAISRIKGGAPDKSVIGKPNPVFSYNPIQAGVPDVIKQAQGSKIKIELPDGTKLKVGKKGELVPDTAAPALTYSAPKGDALALQYMAQKFGAFQSEKPQTPWRGITFKLGEKRYPIAGYGAKSANPVYANIGLTDFKYWGKEYVPAVDIVEPKVLSGEMQFPTSRETAKALMLEFKGKKYALKGEGMGGWHATVANIAKQTRTQAGTSESPGLYVAPSLSKYFLRTGDKGASSYSLFGMFDKPQGGPSALFIKTSDITRIPRGIRSKGMKAMNEWLAKSAAKDKGYISPAFEFGKTEKEAIIPQDTLLSKRDKSFWGFDKYTVVDNTKVPIKTYDITMEAAARNTVPFKAVSRQYEKEMNSYRNFKKPIISAERILKNSYNMRAKEAQQYTPSREYRPSSSSYRSNRRMPYSEFKERYSIKREAYRPSEVRRPYYGGSSYRAPIARSRIVEERRNPIRDISRVIERARPRPPPRNIYRGSSQRPPTTFRYHPSAKSMYNPSRMTFKMPKFNLGRWKSKTMYSLRPDLTSSAFSQFIKGSASKPQATRNNIEEFKKYLDARQPFFTTREQRRK